MKWAGPSFYFQKRLEHLILEIGDPPFYIGGKPQDMPITSHIKDEKMELLSNSIITAVMRLNKI